MRIYTKTGDKGETGLFNGSRVPKDDLRVQAYGIVDELNSILGLYRADQADPLLFTEIRRVQEELFELGADLATPGGNKSLDLLSDATLFLEKRIDEIMACLPGLRSFILPGGSIPGAQLHIARTICRRAERKVLSLMREEEIPDILLIYLNRLSDYLFALARHENHRLGTGDELWTPRT